MRLRDIIIEDVVDMANVSLRKSTPYRNGSDPTVIQSYTFGFPLKDGGELEAYVRAAGDTLEFADIVFLRDGKRNPDTFATSNRGGVYSFGVRLGTAETRRLLSHVVKTVRDDHPAIKKLSSTRVTGARAVSGKMNMSMALPEAYEKRDLDEAYIMETTRPHAESGEPFPDTLHSAREIASFLVSVQSDYDVDAVEQQFEDHEAVLRLIPSYDLSAGSGDHHARSVSKEKRFATMNPDTMPPLLVQNGEILDGNHRFRVGIAKGQKAFWCYVIR
jgi:hypothetical protein